MGRVTLENVSKVCHYQPPTQVQIPKYKAISDATEAFIRIILENAPDCADKSEAIRNARYAKLNANSAVALEGEI